MPGGKCVFNKLWLEKEDYKEWLLQDDRSKAKCGVCSKIFDISGMGESAIKVHMKGAKHISYMESKRKSCEISHFYKSSQTSKQDKEATTSTCVSTINDFMSRQDVLDAEILWVFKCIRNHYSYKSSEDVNKLFQKMFPDSQIAKKFKCGEKKCAYLCYFGLAPYIKSVLLKSMDEIEYFTLLFDETLNETNQKKQMDIHLRFWSIDQNVRTQYLTSIFMGHATAEDIFSNFMECVQKLDLNKLLQISMDGPNVNWKFYSMIQDELSKNMNVKCISIGSCGLHILNNAFKAGHSNTQWDVTSILTAMHWFFKDSPARREDFLSISQLKKLPVKFCNCRWLENAKVAERAIEIWDDITGYIKAIEKGTFAKVNNKSFTTLIQAVKDQTTLIKLNCFVSVAKVIKPFLELYQSDKPLVPFFGEDILKLVNDLLSLFKVLKPECNIINVNSLIKFKFSDVANYAEKSKVSLGFAADRLMKTKLKRKEITEADSFALKYDCQRFVLKILDRLMEKCPINYAVVKSASCFNPRLMAKKPNSINELKEILVCFVNNKRLSQEDCDDILLQYSHFSKNVVNRALPAFIGFNHMTMSLDEFLCPYFQDPQYGKLWKIAKMVMILSHGQASVERGFSVNKAIEVENLKDDSYIAQRIVYEFVKFSGGTTAIVVNKEMRNSALSARAKYLEYLDNQKSTQKHEDVVKKRKLLDEDINFLKQKKAFLMSEIEDREKEADSLAEKAETQRNLSLFMKSNELRKTVKENKSHIDKIDQEISTKKLLLKEN